MAAWLEREVAELDLRAFLEGITRVSTYCADLTALSAGAAIANIASVAADGVRYLDGGWQSLVDGLVGAAQRARATIVTHAHVTAIDDIDSHGRRAVRLADGRSLPADAVIVVRRAGPGVGAAAVERVARRRRARRRAGARRLPRPGAAVAAAAARALRARRRSAGLLLGPLGRGRARARRWGGGARRCATSTVRSADDDAEAELSALCDRMQPGWRERVVERRFLPRMTVANDLPRARAGGLGGRASVAVADAPGVYVAGDWVGPEGMLADAVVGSAAAAARLAVAAHLVRRAA